MKIEEGSQSLLFGSREKEIENGGKRESNKKVSTRNTEGSQIEMWC